MNKLAIHTHVNFRPRNAMFFLLNNYVFRGTGYKSIQCICLLQDELLVLLSLLLIN